MTRNAGAFTGGESRRSRLPANPRETAEVGTPEPITRIAGALTGGGSRMSRVRAGSRETAGLETTEARERFLDAYAVRFPRSAAGEQDKLGGLITPR